MAKYRKKPIVIEAYKFSNENRDEVYKWAIGIQSDVIPSTECGSPCLIIPTNEGDIMCRLGDYLIKEPYPTNERNLYPCKPSIFEKTYELEE